ncbi:hypothetical protein [Microcoleus sp. herbarium12]|uniref:hypothetical protein n=1 Tax=Microcoleus sp. herbarium12 TaxID=3055437 RepID=UPI002FD73F22
MMKMRSPLSFTINLLIFSVASLPILAQSTPTIQSLPNGDYFTDKQAKQIKLVQSTYSYANPATSLQDLPTREILEIDIVLEVQLNQALLPMAHTFYLKKANRNRLHFLNFHLWI